MILSEPVIPRSVRGVFFDCDGVLVDSWNSTMHYFNSIRASVGLGPISPEDEEYCFVHTVPESVAHIIPEEHVEAAMQTARTFPFEAELVPLLELSPGIVGFLDRLIAAGKKLGVCTNADKEQHIILKKLGIHDRFEMVVTTQDVKRGKPSPEGLKLLLECLALEPDQAIFIGDSRLDRLAAWNAGIPFWGYGPTAPMGVVSLSDFDSVVLE